MCEYGTTVVLNREKSRDPCENQPSGRVDFDAPHDIAPNNVELCSWHIWLLVVNEGWTFSRLSPGAQSVVDAFESQMRQEV